MEAAFGAAVARQRTSRSDGRRRRQERDWSMAMGECLICLVARQSVRSAGGGDAAMQMPWDRGDDFVPPMICTITGQKTPNPQVARSHEASDTRRK